MSADTTGRSLFIVDNSVSGWTGLRYLKEWAGISRAFDVATGYFEIGALLALDGEWQRLDRIRLLMGAETSRRTRRVLLDAVRARAVGALDDSLEADKRDNPFLRGVPAILEALRQGKIECRIYDRAKFHAKAYITHARLEVVGAQALVGSSNFTRPGLTQNVEFNVQVQSAREVAQLREWFEAHWNEAREATDTIIKTIARHTRRATAVAQFTHRVIEHAGAAEGQVQAAAFNLAQVVTDDGFDMVFDRGQFLGPLQQKVVGEGGDGGGDRRAGRSVVHGSNITM